jgi:prenylcysteine oxidase/farnesylcysteine lyase
VQEYLYKIFSPAPVNATFLADLLGVKHLPGNDEDEISKRDVSWIHRKVWNSYPYEYPRVTFEDAKLADGSWYTGGMDSFISTMETNALMGKNVARLIADTFAEKSDEDLEDRKFKDGL